MPYDAKAKEKAAANKKRRAAEGKKQIDFKALALKLFGELNGIPCTCIEAYVSRKLTDPSCPRCNCVDENVIADARNALELAKAAPATNPTQQPAK